MSSYREIAPEEAASYIENNQCIACSGFTPAGSVKAIPKALSIKAEGLHAQNKPFKVNLITGASSGDSLDGSLARANAISFRMPYQTSSDLRNAINASSVHFCDLHLSHFPQQLNYNFFGEVDWAIVEVADFNEKGDLVLTASVGSTPTFCRKAKRILLEHNTYHPPFLKGLHDIFVPENPPNRKPLGLCSVKDRIGSEVINVDPRKIVGVVKTYGADEAREFKESNEVQEKIGRNVAIFLSEEIKKGRIPNDFLPVQSGVGNIANAVLKAMGEQAEIPPFIMYSEIVQNAVLELMDEGRISFASATALTVTNEVSRHIYDNWSNYKDKLVLRPQEITNHPEIIRRLGVLSINTALEVDLFGHVNSTHVFGNTLMNGIGGSGDFTRNAYISIFTLPSTAKAGKISGIVPFCSHVDHTEHEVQVIITEHGIADLRGKSPIQRAEAIINQCAHPDYRSLLKTYLKIPASGHIRHSLEHAFAFHRSFMKEGDMRLVEKMFGA